MSGVNWLETIMNAETGQSQAEQGAQSRRVGAGFTLIELAIAVAVVFVGILALFALITSGLDESGKAVADTQSALFAESVFNGLGAMSQRAATNNLSWRQEWNSIAAKTTLVTLPAPAWKGSDPTRGMVYSITADVIPARPPMPAPRTIVFTNFAFRVTGEPAITTYALRYLLLIGNTNAMQFPLATSGATVWDNVVIPARLSVWDGEYGITDTNNALTFYTEFDNPGDL